MDFHDVIGLSFDFGKLRQEANFRWLKNPEVLFILQNHENFLIEEEIPEKPISNTSTLLNIINIIIGFILSYCHSTS